MTTNISRNLKELCSYNNNYNNKTYCFALLYGLIIMFVVLLILIEHNFWP